MFLTVQYGEYFDENFEFASDKIFEIHLEISLLKRIFLARDFKG